MYRKIKSIFLFLYVGLFSCSNLLCQLSEFNFDLSSKKIITTIQDSYGLTWIATEEGLNMFDGKIVHSFESILADNTTLINNSILILAVDEARKAASGCSIDSSVHMIKHLEKELKIDFFNRF